MVTEKRPSLLQGLADPTRWRIVELLSAGAMAVGEIAAEFPMSRPAISKHLRVLRLAGLVVERKEGRRRIYELVAEALEETAARLGRLASGGGTRTLRGRPVGRVAPASPGFAKPTPSAAPAEVPAGEEADDGRWRSW